MSGEPVGEVKLSSGDFITAAVGIESGRVFVRQLAPDRRYRNAFELDAADVNAVGALIIRAGTLVPGILAAHQTRQKAVLAAEAGYERAVAVAIGGTP